MWELIDRKATRDFDGFMTEVSMYCDGERFVIVFGDSDLYWVEDESNWEFETESAIEAYELFSDF